LGADGSILPPGHEQRTILTCGRSSREEPALIQNERDAERTRASYPMMHDSYRKKVGLPGYAALAGSSFILPHQRHRSKARESRRFVVF
jgi:hypothetical protein